MKEATKTEEFQKLYDMYVRCIKERKLFSEDKDLLDMYIYRESCIEDVADELFGVDIWQLWLDNRAQEILL